jgi:hypothetical protein
MPELEAKHALIHALRDRGRETELTQAVAAFLTSDPPMAGSFVQAVLDRAPLGESMFQVPVELECRAEESVERGRLDLSFSDEVTRARIAVELKIHAGFHGDQLQRYLNHLPRENAALVAITRDVPTYGDPESGDGRWRGSVQWGKLLPDLRHLRPADTDLARQWPLLLDVLESEGSMGFTKPDPELFRVYERSREARDHIELFMDSIRVPLLQALAETLGVTEDEIAFETRGKKRRAVFPSQRMMTVAFRIPPSKSPRVWAAVWAWDGLCFEIKTAFPNEDSVEAASAIAALEAGGFRNWQDQVLTSLLPLDASLIEDQGLDEKVLAWSKDRFEKIAASGILSLTHVATPVALEDEGEP